MAAAYATAKYNSCLADMYAQKSEAQRKCAQYQGEAALSACNDKLLSTEGIISYCKIKSGIAESAQACTVEEAEKAAALETARNTELGRFADPKAAFEAAQNKSLDSPKTVLSLSLNGADSTVLGEDVVVTSASSKRPMPRPENVANTQTRSNPGASQKATDKPADTAKVSAASRGSAQAGNDDPGVAQAQADADISACSNLQARANQCCGNPLSCASSSDRDLLNRLNQPPPSDSAGLKAYCDQMQTLGNSSAAVNNRLGALCTNNQSACSNTCAQLEQKYRSLMASCDNCQSYSVYAAAAAQLSTKGSFCARLASRGDALVAQGLSASSSTGYGAYCAQVAAASPNSFSSNGSAMPQLGQPPAGSQSNGNQNPGYAALNNGYRGANDPYGCLANPNSPACVDCTRNPNSASCRHAVQAQARGEGGFKQAANTASSKNSFNLAENSDNYIPEPSYGGPAVDRNVAYNQVPNNSGGGFQGGGATQPASLGGNRSSGSAPAAGKASATEIEQGFRSGGYSQPASGGGSGFEPEVTYRARGTGATAGGAGGSQYVGLDLKQYLPGGSLDPGRRLAGVAKASGINVKEEDIWRRISIKIYEKCRLGVLWRCD